VQAVRENFSGKRKEEVLQQTVREEVSFQGLPQKKDAAGC